MTHLQKLKSIRLCLSAHPDNEAGSEFEDRIDDLDEMIRTMESVDIALRDDFAKAAMQAIMGSDNLRSAAVKDSREQGLSHVDFVAQCAYDIAYAMMQERERRIKG